MGKRRRTGLISRVEYANNEYLRTFERSKETNGCQNDKKDIDLSN